MTESWLECLRNEVAARLDGGADSADLQDELVDTARGLSDDEQAALWLFAWAYRPSRPGPPTRAAEAVL